jgi:hypothetical protein
LASNQGVGSSNLSGRTSHTKGFRLIAGKILVVSTGMGGKSKQIGSTPAEILAEQLLRELAKEGKA